MWRRFCAAKDRRFRRKRVDVVAVVIVRDEDGWGIYLGHALGFAFWSRGECGGQYRAVVFCDEKAARVHIAEWRPAVLQSAFICIDVPFGSPFDSSAGESAFVEIEHLKTAGLEAQLGGMELERLADLPASGSA